MLYNLQDAVMTYIEYRDVKNMHHTNAERRYGSLAAQQTRQCTQPPCGCATSDRTKRYSGETTISDRYSSMIDRMINHRITKASVTPTAANYTSSVENVADYCINSTEYSL